ncbi:MAG: glycosyltransferase family 2 protein [Acidobacteriota bacterium]|nr:glycosyltransferase family 2 protein [Acidobacteriota bacterium]
MPLAAKKNRRTEKVTPAQLDVEPLPVAQEEQPPITPKVTALINSYNNANGLRRCLAALEQSKDRSSLEILVVDRGSRDESPTLDAEFPNTTFLRLPRNFGTTKALNIGTRTAAGELIFFLSPEITVAPDTVSALVAQLEANPEIMAACPMIVDVDSLTQAEQVYRLPRPETGAALTSVPIDLASGSATVEYATFQAMLARKYFVRGINYFDEKYGEFGADAELCFQVRRASRKVVVIPELPVLRTKLSVQRSSSAENLLEADRTHGAAVYFSKHYGFMSGLAFRIKAILKALFSLRFPLLMGLVSGQKIDGSQSVNL